MDRGRWLYDEEMYPNAFILCAKNVDTGVRMRFQISPWLDQRKELATWIANDVVDMVGFNNLEYDYPLLHMLIVDLFKLRGRDLVTGLYNKSSSIIKSRKFNYPVKYPMRPQIDLYKINHFDNKHKRVGLKLLEFNLKMKNIQELPYPPGTVLTAQQIITVIEYCENDVDATGKVYEETIPEIELREKMSAIYGIDFTNFNSTKMGEHILIKKIIQALGERVAYNIIERDNGSIKKVPRNTKREQIDLSEAVFDYIEFTTLPFQRILEWFKSRIIKETNGVFSNIPLEELSLIEGYYAIREIKWHPLKEKMIWASLVNTKNELKKLNVINFGFQYDFGVGGIHGSTVAGIYRRDDEHDIRDIDVASYYPNLGIVNRFYPQHMGEEFCDIYQSIYEERKKYPKKTHKMENLALKLALNGSYGKSNSAYSPLYDPMYTMKTTVNGQLLLCRLSEALMTRVPDCEMLQINTDGMTVRFKKQYNPWVDEICKEWEELTKLELESVNYDMMVIKDVNNYLAIDIDGNVKRKGAAFIHKIQPGELQLDKNFSKLVIPKALEAYFVDGVIPEDFVSNHKNAYDFFVRTKIKRNDKLFAKTYDDKGNEKTSKELQRITRYVISGEVLYDKSTKTYRKVGTGYTFVKQMPPLPGKDMIRHNQVQAGYLCTPFNIMDSEEAVIPYIYYPYYIGECYKTINIIENEGVTAV